MGGTTMPRDCVTHHYCQCTGDRLREGQALVEALGVLVKSEYPAEMSLAEIARTYGTEAGLSYEQIMLIEKGDERAHSTGA